MHYILYIKIEQNKIIKQGVRDLSPVPFRNVNKKRVLLLLLFLLKQNEIIQKKRLLKHSHLIKYLTVSFKTF